MNGDDLNDAAISRRDFLRTASVGVMALGLGANGDASSAAPITSPRASAASGVTGAYNILFIVVAQEPHFLPVELPVGYRLPANERLAKQGTTFVVRNPMDSRPFQGGR